MPRRLPLLLLVSGSLACPGNADVEPLASSPETARPFSEGPLAAHAFSRAFARALPQGLETPVFALTLYDGEISGFQFEVDAEHADFQVHGLRRLVARLSPDTPVAIWLAPADDPGRRRVAVMTLNAWPWRVVWAAAVPETVDHELLERLLDSGEGPEATLHEVSSDHVTLEFDEPAGELAALLVSEGMTDEQRQDVKVELSRRRLTLPLR